MEYLLGSVGMIFSRDASCCWAFVLNISGEPPHMKIVPTHSDCVAEAEAMAQTRGSSWESLPVESMECREHRGIVEDREYAHG